MISGGIGSFTDAFFEAMSGFTTTGATIIDYPEYLPKGLLFLAFIDTMDWWIGNSILYYSHSPVYGGWFGKGLCG